MTQLLQEIITDILCRLPVKSLLRFRCISKSCCTQIDSPYFIKLHYNHSIKTNTNQSLIHNDPVHLDTLFSADLDTLDTAIKLHNPIEGSDGGTKVLGTCNGIVALSNSYEDIVLCNPFTRKYHILPITPIEIPRDNIGSIDYGFGYDPVSNDYKLVRIVIYYCKGHEKTESQVMVYSLKSNSWRRTRDLPSCLYYYLTRGILANNALHWMLDIQSQWPDIKRIFAFDLRVEEFFEVPQPDYGDKNFFSHVESLRGCLCVVCNYVFLRHDIWVMKEYGVKESWTKLFSVAKPELNRSFHYIKPLACSKNGDKVLLEQHERDKEFVWYDMNKKRAEKVRIQVPPKLFKVEICVGSLVPVNGGQQAQREIRKTGNQKFRMFSCIADSSWCCKRLDKDSD